LGDNYVTDPGAGGNTFASDDIAGVHYPYVKLVWGADGVATLVTPAAPLPVVQTGALPAGTNNIGDVDVLTLPAITGTVSISGSVDTELPAPVALGDAMANPTVPQVGAHVLGWNNIDGDWERIRVSDAAAGCLFVSIANVETSASLAVNDAGSSLTIDTSGGPISATISGTATTKELRSGTAATSQVADNASDVQLLASNASRLKYTIVNDSSAILFIRCGGGAASTTNYSVKIAPNALWEDRDFTGEVRGIWATDPNDGAARITEYT